ncbi:hypothetical protein [Aestuariispira insulae]|nr:hypothetical protein [Aestuariispira insulae]
MMQSLHGWLGLVDFQHALVVFRHCAPIVTTVYERQKLSASRVTT